MGDLRCIICGIETEAKCSCGKGYDYIPAAKAAALAVAAHPDWSPAKLAEMVGVGASTIVRARAGSPNGEPEKRTGRDGKQYKARKPRNEKYEAARQAMRANVEAGKPHETKKHAEQLNVSVDTVERALHAEHARKEILDEMLGDPASLSLTAQKKLEAFGRKHQRYLDSIFEDTVLKEIRRRVEEYVAPRFAERERDADLLRFNRKGAFSRKEYNAILRCVHPDRSPTIEEKNEAFRLLHEKRLLLLSEKDDPRTYPPIPTKEEFMAGIRVKRSAS